MNPKTAMLYIMKVKIIAIAGGTGAGKSTVAYALADKYPEKISILHLDDYQWHGENRVKVPLFNGIRNWDHPDVIDWNALIIDLKKLKAGQEITLMSKSERVVPRKIKDNDETPTPRLPLTIQPKEVILLEGYLALWNPQVRELLDYSFYLDAGHDVRMQRRTNFLNKEYEEKVLVPMQKEYVESTKKFANEVIDVSKFDIPQVRDIIEQSWRKIPV